MKYLLSDQLFIGEEKKSKKKNPLSNQKVNLLTCQIPLKRKVIRDKMETFTQVALGT